MTAPESYTCLSCDRSVESISPTCPDCGGPLDPRYDLASSSPTSEPSPSRWDCGAPLPDVSPDVTMGEMPTPLVDCPTLSNELGLDAVTIKDEGRNPTGSVADRGLPVELSVVHRQGVSDIVLPSPGPEGHAAAAYGARADIATHVYLPARAGFSAKALVNVHGADMTVVQGRYPAAASAARAASQDHDWTPVGPGQPHFHDGCKTIAYELYAQLGGSLPDAIVCPAGTGATVYGIVKGARELERAGAVSTLPEVYAAQASGCDPIASALESGEETPTAIEHPDTICGPIEIPDPALGGPAVEAVCATDGGGVTATDDEILEAAVTVAAHEGVAMAPSAAAAAAGLSQLVATDRLAPDSTVVLVSTVGGASAADVLRSHLMGQGV